MSLFIENAALGLIWVGRRWYIALEIQKANYRVM
jgi:hypothetical protein